MERATTRRTLIGAGAVTALGGLASPRGALPQTLDRPARLIMNFSAGGVMDTVARLYAERLRGIYAP
jgi:tripartite-type tricarboxylate transporter receptor subunit TctC